MKTKKGYKGYTSYSYLEPGKDYKRFELTSGYNEFNNGVNEYYPLHEDQEAMMNEIISKYPMISLHEHPYLYPKHMKAEGYSQGCEGRAVTAFKSLAESAWDCVFDHLMDGLCMITSKRGWKWSDVTYDLSMRLCDIAHQDFIIPCKSTDDILKAKKEGKLAWVPSMEGCMPIENEIDRFDMLYGMGVRLMGITYSDANALGCGLKEECDGGLTYLGKQAIDRMNKLGMAIDCSHSGPKTSMDTIKFSKKPIIMTHTGARSLWDSKRLMPDDVLLECAKRGGIIGIEGAPHTTMVEGHPHDIESYMAHFEYIVNLCGIDYVGFGPDTIYGDHVGVHDAFADAIAIDQAFQKKEVDGSVSFPHVKYVKYLENPTEGSYNILRWLIAHNYSEKDIAKVMGGNAMRVLGEVWN